MIKFDRRRPAPESFGVVGETYDTFQINVNPSYKSKDEMSGSFSTNYEVAVAIPDGGGTGQSAAFEGVLEALFSVTLGVVA